MLTYIGVVLSMLCAYAINGAAFPDHEIAAQQQEDQILSFSTRGRINLKRSWSEAYGIRDHVLHLQEIDPIANKTFLELRNEAFAKNVPWLILVLSYARLPQCLFGRAKPMKIKFFDLYTLVAKWEQEKGPLDTKKTIFLDEVARPLIREYALKGPADWHFMIYAHDHLNPKCDDAYRSYILINNILSYALHDNIKALRAASLNLVKRNYNNRACFWIEHYLEHKPNDKYMLNKLGNIYYEQRNHSAARSCFKKAMKLGCARAKKSYYELYLLKIILEEQGLLH